MKTGLEYPLDISKILRKKKLLKKKLLVSDDLVEKNIAILGGSTTSEIKNILELFLLKNNIKPNFYESEYNKYYEDALFGQNKLKTFKPDIIYVHTSFVNIRSFPKLDDNEKNTHELLNDEVEKYKSIWDALAQYNCAIIQNNFDFPINRSLGNLDSYDIHGKTHFVNQLNLEFARYAREIKSLYINDINYLSGYIGLKNWFDKSLWYRAKYALSMDAIPELAFNISKIILGILGKTKKCLVLDLDNTCWGGVIGDDGLGAIHIGEGTAIAESFRAFQQYVKELEERGVTLAVCSKNDLENAKEGFMHPESVLKYDDFTSFKANWNPKYENILDIAKEINIGIDSLVFVDDNPAERGLVSAQAPSVAVPDVGNDVIHFIDHLDRNSYFEPISLSAEDMSRNRYYEDNKKRQKEKVKFESYDDFLLSLEMQAEIQSFIPIYTDRITQLINKTNQFNLTTKRYTVSEVEAVLQSDKHINLYGKLSDKYGDNGLVSVVIGKIEGKQCHVDLWIMSCRVLKREMEFAMLDVLVEHCLDKGVSEIIGYYYKTAKNAMVSDLYDQFGFILTEEDSEKRVFKLGLREYKNKNSFIRCTSER